MVCPANRGAVRPRAGEERSVGRVPTKSGTHEVGGAAPGAEWVRAFETVTGRLNEVLEAMQTLRSYIGAFVSTDAGNDKAQALLSEHLRVVYGRTDLEMAVILGVPPYRHSLRQTPVPPLIIPYRARAAALSMPFSSRVTPRSSVGL